MRNASFTTCQGQYHHPTRMRTGHTLGAKDEVVRKNNVRVGDMFPYDFMIAKVAMVESMGASFESPQAATFEENL